MYSVVIVTYNSARVIGSCIRAVQEECRSGHDAEIIVVDNASSDRTAEIVRKEFPSVSFVQNSFNAGFAAGANEGAKEARGEYLLFLNPDAMMKKGFFEAITKRFDLDAKIAIAGSAITDAQGKRLRSCWKEPSLFTVAAEAFLPYELAVRLVTLAPRSGEDVPMVSGACLAIRSAAFKESGGFDERFFMYYEDADLCLRTRRAGHRVLFTDETAVAHHVSQSFAGDLTNFFLHVYRSKITFFRIHHTAITATIVRWMVLAGAAIRIPLYGIVGTVIGSANLRRLGREHARILPMLLKGD